MDKAVGKYRRRRDLRIKKRMDAGDKGRWITTENNHKVHLNEQGEPDKGNPHVIDTMKQGGKSFTSGGKTWDKESLTQLWQDRGYSKKHAEARAERDLNETLAAQKKNEAAAKAATRAPEKKTVSLGYKTYDLDKMTEDWKKKGYSEQGARERAEAEFKQLEYMADHKRGERGEDYTAGKDVENITRGTMVRIRPEWRRPEEGDTEYIMLEDYGDGKVTIGVANSKLALGSSEMVGKDMIDVAMKDGKEFVHPRYAAQQEVKEAARQKLEAEKAAKRKRSRAKKYSLGGQTKSLWGEPLTKIDVGEVDNVEWKDISKDGTERYGFTIPGSRVLGASIRKSKVDGMWKVSVNEPSGSGLLGKEFKNREDAEKCAKEAFVRAANAFNKKLDEQGTIIGKDGRGTAAQELKRLGEKGKKKEFADAVKGAFKDQLIDTVKDVKEVEMLGGKKRVDVIGTANGHEVKIGFYNGHTVDLTPDPSGISKAKKEMQDAARKEAKKIGTSTQVIGDDLYVSTTTAQFYPHSSRTHHRIWGKVVDKPTYKNKIGDFGNFEAYSKGFWDKGDNDSYGYEFVLKR